MVGSFGLENAPCAKERKTFDTLVNIVSFRVDFYLFVGGLNLLLLGSSIVKLSSRYP